MLVLAGLGAAVLLAAGYVLQQHEAAEVPGGGFRPRLLLELAGRPIWLGGIGAMVAGQLLGAVALGMGSLIVVEPLLSANVLFALPLAALASRRRLTAGDWSGAVLLIGGLTLFLTGAAPRSAVERERLPPVVWVLSGGVVLAAVLALLVLAPRRSARARAALMATAAGVTFGMQDFLTQRSILRLGGGVVPFLASWVPWTLLAVAIVGLTFAQTAFGLADISASLPAITLAEPVVGIALSMGALGQGFPHFPGKFAAAVAGLSLMVAGVVILTRSPLVVDPHGTRHRRHPHLSRPHRSRSA